MTAIRRSCFALIVLLFAPPLVRADLTAKPNAYTEKDRHRECLEFNLKTLVDSYKSIGNKIPPGMPKPSSSSNPLPSISPTSLQATCTTTNPHLAGAHRAGRSRRQERAATIPSSSIATGAFLTESGRADDGKPVLQQAYKGLIQSKYPPERVYFAAKRPARANPIAQGSLRHLHRDGQGAHPHGQEQVHQRRPSPPRRRLADCGNHRTPHQKQLDFYEQMVKDKETDKWIINLYGGRYFIKPPGPPAATAGPIR